MEHRVVAVVDKIKILQPIPGVAVDENTIWNNILNNAIVNKHSPIAGLRYSQIAVQDSYRSALAFLITTTLQSNEFPYTALFEPIHEALDDAIIKSSLFDLQKIVDGDPAAKTESGEPNYLHPFAWFQGFQALEAYRVAHKFYKNIDQHTGFALEHITFKALSADIHPAARIGHYVQFDHLSGLVIGETAVIGDGTYILHGVTLGGRGDQPGDRHPKIGNDVVIGAGAKIIGNIYVGDGVWIGANSTVTKSVPAHKTVTGAKAEVRGDSPARRAELEKEGSGI